MTHPYKRDCGGVSMQRLHSSEWRGYTPWGALLHLKEMGEGRGVAYWKGGIYTMRLSVGLLSPPYEIETRPIRGSADFERALKQLEELVQDLIKEMRTMLGVIPPSGTPAG